VNKLDWETFKDLFHPSWHPKMQEIIESPEMWNTFQFIKNESRRGVKLTPLSKDLFRSFQVDLSQLKLVLMLMDVYPQFKFNKPVANGIAMDCEYYGSISPSLEKFYDAVEDDCYKKGTMSEAKKNKRLQYLVDQGVMLTNVSLLTEKDKSGKHIELFKPFWSQIFDKIFAPMDGLIFIAMGKEAQKMLNQYSIPFNHYVLECEHPVAAARNNRDMEHKNVFSKANKLLEEQGKKKIEFL